MRSSCRSASSASVRVPRTCGRAMPASSSPRCWISPQASSRRRSTASRMIRFDSVSKRYPNGYEALRGINLHIRRGEMVFITGHSGAGKSTLLRLIPLLERPSNGQVLVAGLNLVRLRRGLIPQLRRRIGMIFHDYRLRHDRTVYDNVALPLVIAGVSPLEIGRRVRAALDKVDLLDRERVYPVTLS